MYLNRKNPAEWFSGKLRYKKLWFERMDRIVYMLITGNIVIKDAEKNAMYKEFMKVILEKYNEEDN